MQHFDVHSGLAFSQQVIDVSSCLHPSHTQMLIS